jgi:hypothetical protein
VSAFRKCEVEDCNGRVLVATGHRFCAHHRPRPSRVGELKAYDTPEKRRKAKLARRRRRDSAGVLWL